MGNADALRGTRGGRDDRERPTLDGPVSAALFAAKGADALLRDDPWYRSIFDTMRAAERAGRDPLPLLADALVLLCRANAESMRLHELLVRTTLNPFLEKHPDVGRPREAGVARSPHGASNPEETRA